MRNFLPLLLIVFMVHVNESAAQGTYFQKVIVTGAFEAQSAQKIIRTAENNYFLMGTCAWGILCGSDASGALIDSSGNLLWSFYYDHNHLGDNFLDAVATPDSGVIIVGSSELNLPTPITPVIIVMKINKSGNVVWCKTDSVCQGCTYIFGQAITATNDGNYIIQSSNLGIPGIYKITQAGNLLWYKEHSINAFNIFPIVHAIPYKNGETISVFNSLLSPNGVIVTYDSLGNVTSLYDIIIPATTFQPNSLSRTNDNGFIITGCMNPLSGTDSIAIIKTDSLYNVLWAHIYTNSSLSITKAIQNKSGNYFLSCNTLLNSTDNYSVLIKTDSVGNVINSIRTIDLSSNYDILESGNDLMLAGGYGYGLLTAKADDAFTSICSQAYPLNDFSFTVTTSPHLPLGTSSPDLSNWVDHPVTLVHNSVSTNLCLNTSLPEPESSFNIEVYPNPVSSFLNVKVNGNEGEFSEIVLYDLTSHKLIQEKFIGSCSLNIKQLANGIYIYEVINKNGSRKKGKVVKD